MSSGTGGAGLSPVVSAALTVLSSTRRGFWLRLGKHVPASMVVEKVPSLVHKLCLEVAADHEYPSVDLVIQRAHAWQLEGKADAGDIVAVMDLLTEAPPMDEEKVLLEVVPLVQKELGMSAARQTVQRAMSGAPFGDLSDRLRQIDKLGEAVADLQGRSSEIGDDTESILGDIEQSTCLMSGILELDTMLGGGYRIMTLTTFMADTGAGKSLMLSHHAAASALQGLNVGYISTELSKAEVHSRVLAAISGIPITSIKRDPKARQMAIQIRDRLRSQGKLGRVRVEKVDAGAATPKDCIDWVRAQERDMGEKIHILIVDYADELVSGDRKVDAEGYNRGTEVWNGLAVIAHDDTEPRWVFTASQSKRPDLQPGKPVPLLTLSGVADSYGKPRKCDHWVSITPTPDMAASEGYRYSMDKHRTDDASVVGKVIGPIPHMRHIGRMGDMSHL